AQRRHADGECRSGMLHGNCSGGSPQYQEIDIALNQFRDQGRKSIAATLSRTVFDNKVYPLDITELLKPLPEGVELGRILNRRYRFQHADPPQLHRLLRARRERPRGRAAEQRNELPTLHSITSSARARSDDGTSRPSALAVLTLITSSNLVACTTGKSDAFSPLRMRPT